MCLATTSIMATIYLLHLHHTKSRRPFLNSSRKLVFRYLAKLVGMYDAKYDVDSPKEQHAAGDTSVATPVKASFVMESDDNLHKMHEALSAIHHELQKITVTVRQQKDSEAVVELWQRAVQILDRTLFYVYLGVTLIVGIISACVIAL